MTDVRYGHVWRRLGPSPRPEARTQDNVPVVIVGAGPVGLAMALDLGQRGQRVVVLGKLDYIPGGSKAICFSKRSLDILDRLGVGDRMVDKGVTWNIGKIFWQDRQEPIYTFDLLPVKGQKNPAFINLQQYYVEAYLIDALAALPNVELRWGHEVTAATPNDEGVGLSVRTADGAYTVRAQWLIACDGNRSPVRNMLGLDFEGRIFEDNFLIADIRIRDERPAERWFWFDPPFNPGKSALCHLQPDGVWRLDFQLGWNIDRDACVQPENVEPYIRAMLGPDVVFEKEWYSVYTFQCRRMARFVHDRIIFAGDSAHLVSPFGARGCNGGFADIDNLGWKLDLVLRGEADASLLESYNDEAIVTADENILNSTRSTDFLTPKSKTSEVFRDAVLELAAGHEGMRRFVNSGRLSTAVSYPGSSLNTPDEDDWTSDIAPGSPALDAPLGEGWLLERLGGRFVMLTNGDPGFILPGLEMLDISDDAHTELLIERYALTPGAAYLLRPDQYVAARWKSPSRTAIAEALSRAKGAMLS
jgi:3-(3-hydroxy-phenyl)propionate hydroxylase